MGAEISQSKDDCGQLPATLSGNGLQHEPERKSCRRVKTVTVDEEQQEEVEDCTRPRGFCTRKAPWEVSGCTGGTMCTSVDELIFDGEQDLLVPVTLHVYDVGTSRQIRAINRFLRKLGTGIFHCGVEVFGGEWSYSDREDECGVFCCAPGQCKGFRHVEAIDLGRTSLSAAEFRILIAQLQAEWFSEEYHLLGQNCCHFCDEMCQRLGVAPPPQWVNNFAGSLASLTAEAPEGEGEECCIWQACPSAFRCCNGSRVAAPAATVLSDSPAEPEDTEIDAMHASEKTTVGL